MQPSASLAVRKPGHAANPSTTRQERELFKQVANGFTTQKIATGLFIV